MTSRTPKVLAVGILGLVVGLADARRASATSWIIPSQQNVEYPPDEDGNRDRRTDESLPDVYVEFPTNYVPVGRPLSAKVLLVNRSRKPIDFAPDTVAASVRVSRASGEPVKAVKAAARAAAGRRVLEPGDGAEVAVDLGHYPTDRPGVYVVEYRSPLGGGVDLVSDPSAVLVEDAAEARKLAAARWPADPKAAAAVAELLAAVPAFPAPIVGRLPAGFQATRDAGRAATGEMVLPAWRPVATAGQSRAWYQSLDDLTRTMPGPVAADVAWVLAERAQAASADFAARPDPAFGNELYRLARRGGKCRAADFLARFFVCFHYRNTPRLAEDVWADPDPVFVPALMQAADHCVPAYDDSAFTVLGAKFVSDIRVRAFLQDRMLYARDPAIAARAAFEVCRWDKDAGRPVLKAALTHRLGRVRHVAASLLAHYARVLGAEDIVPTLRTALRDEKDDDVLRELVQAVARHPSKENLELLSPLRNHNDEYVRRAADDAAAAVAERLKNAAD